MTAQQNGIGCGERFLPNGMRAPLNVDDRSRCGKMTPLLPVWDDGEAAEDYAYMIIVGPHTLAARRGVSARSGAE